MGYCYGWGSSFLGGYWWIFPLIFWGLIIFGVVYLIRAFFRRDENEALAMLKREYAMGRISREDYLNRKKDLER
ncbi:MAG: putative rane protein [Halanaerobiales bacterium]|nr:putative rane protein [Halanaerobiales bacterium]